ncbi:MAG: hypothetical protein HYU64_13690 [Armatimonadetes bacterium]|nr:hypothetical protein [Armatimonadota bacterium]
MNTYEARMTLSPAVRSFFARGVAGSDKVDATTDAVQQGTWSNDKKKDKSDFMPKAQTIGGVLGGISGGFVGYYAARMQEGKVVHATTKEPVYEQKQIGEIPKNHVTPGLSDKGTYPADEKGRALPGTGQPVYGKVPVKNPDGTVKMQETKNETFTWGGPGMALSIAGGIAIGAGLGVLAGTFVGVADKIIHPEDYPADPPPWNRSYSDTPPWSNSYTDNTPWNRSYSDSPTPWDRSYNDSPPWNNSYLDTPWNRSYSDTPWCNSHSNHPWDRSYTDNPWTNSHSETPWSNSHSNSPTPAWSESTPY